ncbi:ParB/RepB/Spo0J family partition protein [Endozoicomonas sp. SM1973]|uniref:ParB/RepB/Spo0J family partition protein n=1 Tax=Spartinivicinus marinus TaxID=2994442 RepID=A0A853I8N5_9GAMM|nr:ParB/RepB/Spo0J family partition protein [Spartinivicinus marinus]MCX4030445.1 ParB/RepB/Spo0J family partition protein [Spartinivicinus marinus]NYZ69673.1 ParB/RepB/Spo0J family partition protein [Spartinivicinus marinus]
MSKDLLDLDDVTAEVEEEKPKRSSFGKKFMGVNPASMLAGKDSAPHMVGEKLKAKDKEIEQLKEQLKQANGSSSSIELRMPFSGKSVSFTLREIEPSLIDVSTINQRIQSLLNDAAVSDILPDIRKNGQSEPGYLRPTKDGRFELIAGSRRLYCVKQIPGRKYLALIGDVPDEDIRHLSRVENKQRPISAYETAMSFYNDINSGIYKTWEQLAEVEDIARSTAFRYKRLVELPEVFVQLFTSPNDMSVTAADWITSALKKDEKTKKLLISKAKDLLDDKVNKICNGYKLLSAELVLKELKRSLLEGGKSTPTRKKPVVYKAKGTPKFKHSLASNNNSKFEILDASTEEIDKIKAFLVRMFKAEAQ